MARNATDGHVVRSKVAKSLTPNAEVRTESQRKIFGETSQIQPANSLLLITTMFRILDGFLQALNDGAILRGAISKILRILAYIRVVFAVLIVIVSLIGLANLQGRYALGTLLIGISWGCLLFIGACLENYRARQIEALPNSSRMTSWIWVNLLRLAGEEGLAFFAVFGVVTFSGVALTGSTSYFNFLPGLESLAFVAGAVAMLVCLAIGGLVFVAFTIAADLISASLDSADTLRRIEMLAVGRAL